MERQAVILYCRYPEAGRTKTRLARELGDAGTLLLYEALLADAAAKLAAVPGCGRLACLASHEPWKERPYDPLRRDPFATFDLRRQPALEFGARLAWSLRTVLEGGFARVVLIGVDSPELRRRDVEDALLLLETNDVAYGPAEDGGYNLIGMKRFHPDLFAGIAWSTKVVLEQSLDAAQRAGLTVGLTPMRADIDFIDDLRALRERLLQARARGLHDSPCPAVEAWLLGLLPEQKGRIPL